VTDRGIRPEQHDEAATRAGARVALVTCAQLPDLDSDDRLLLAPLRAADLTVTAAAWDDPAVDWSAAHVVAVRSTWDYEWRRAEFVSWARAVGPRLLHGADVLAWNIDKSYLLDLEAAGLPVVPTVVATTVGKVEQAAARFGRAVCKPTVGASGRGVVVIDGAASPTVTGVGPWLVQPLVASVRTRGESSLFVMDGRVVSQVDKRPGGTDGTEIRVHEEYGGTAVAVPVDPAAERAALAAMEAAAVLHGRPLDYGRVDLMELDGRLVVGEVELIEPGLYLDVVPANAARFADLVRARLAG
jgi:glutathione synthase/RimK-type ligase-like ATP-grasp enzyme